MPSDHTCPDCGAALHVEDTVMGEVMVPACVVRDQENVVYERLRPVRAVFCCACEFASEWSVFVKKENR